MTNTNERPRSKSDAERAAQIAQAKAKVAATSSSTKANPVIADETYGELRDENRVVMRHNIALNIENFRAATDDFAQRPTRQYPALQEVPRPFFSLLIPNYNGRRLLGPLLDALQRQTFRDFEVILADDASIDDSLAFVEENYAGKTGMDALDLRIVANRQNRGFVANVNAAADVARAPFLVLLNSDTEPEAEWLAELARAVCAHPQAAVVTSKVLLNDGTGRLHTTGDMLGLDGIPRNRGVWEADTGQYDAQVNVFGGNGGASVFRRAVWQELGGFDEDFWMYLEDVDFAFRAQLVGYEAVFAPQARIYHHLSATSGHTLASYYVGRNTIWTIAKNMPRGLLVRNLPRIVAAQVRIAVNALRHIRGAAARARLRGQLAGLAGLPRQLRKRQVIQPRRITEDDVLRQKLAWAADDITSP